MSDVQKGTETSQAHAHMQLAIRIEQAGLPKTLIKWYSIRICAAKAYDNSTEAGMAIAGFMCVCGSGSVSM